MADNTVQFAGRAMTAAELVRVINVMWSWLKVLDTERVYSGPNGHVWAAIDEAHMLYENGKRNG
jgi:hypothetical protein